MTDELDDFFKKYNLGKHKIFKKTTIIDIEKALNSPYSMMGASDKYVKYKSFTFKPGEGPDPDENSSLDWPDMDTDPAILLPEPDYGNFKRIMKHEKWILLEHQVTKERKWVSLSELHKEGVANAFYDADIHFCPENVSKWR